MLWGRPLAGGPDFIRSTGFSRGGCILAKSCSQTPATLFSSHVHKLGNNWGVGRDALAAGARYRGGVRNWVRPHRTPIHSSDVLGHFARVEPVSFAAEIAAASATASGGRTGVLRGLPSEESSGPTALGHRAALPFWEIGRIGDPQMKSSGAGGAGGGITPAQNLAACDDVVVQA
jgi:hypothetical protein